MEDIKQTISPPKLKLPSNGGKTRHSSLLTVMIVRGVGKVRKFKISSRFLFWSFLFFLTYIAASAVVIYQYFEELRINNDLAERVSNLQQEIEATKRDFYRSKEHLALLEQYLQETETVEEKTTSSTGSDGKKAAIDEPADNEEPAEKAKEQLPKAHVAIKDVVVLKEKTTLKVDFILVNLQKDKTSRGYVHIIAGDTQSDPPRHWSYPEVALKNGIPTEYKKGLIFYIKRFKSIHGEFDLKGTKSPISVKVLIYDQTGRLILEKEFEEGKM